MNELHTSPPPTDQSPQPTRDSTDTTTNPAGMSSGGTDRVTPGAAGAADGRSGPTGGPPSTDDRDTGFAASYLADRSLENLTPVGSTPSAADPVPPAVGNTGQTTRHSSRGTAGTSGGGSAFGTGAGGGAVDSGEHHGGGDLPEGFVGASAGHPDTSPVPAGSPVAGQAVKPVPTDSVYSPSDAAPAPEPPVLQSGGKDTVSAPESADHGGPVSGSDPAGGHFTDAYLAGPREGDPPGRAAGANPAGRAVQLGFAIPVAADTAAANGAAAAAKVVEAMLGPVGPVEQRSLSDAKAYNLWTSAEPDVYRLTDKQFAEKYLGRTKQEVTDFFKAAVTRVREADARTPKIDVDRQYQAERQRATGLEVIGKMAGSVGSTATVMARSTVTRDVDELNKAADDGHVIDGISAGVAGIGKSRTSSNVTRQANRGPADEQAIRRNGLPSQPPTPRPASPAASPPAGAAPLRAERPPADPPRAGFPSQVRQGPSESGTSTSDRPTFTARAGSPGQARQGLSESGTSTSDRPPAGGGRQGSPVDSGRAVPKPEAPAAKAAVPVREGVAMAGAPRASAEHVAAVEAAMRANPRNTIGAGGEASALVTLRADGRPAADLNGYRRNIPTVDQSSPDGFFSVKTRGVGEDSPSAQTLKKYEGDVKALVTKPEPGTIPVPAEKAAGRLSAIQADLVKAGAWPTALPANSSPEQIAEHINTEGRLLVPSDYVVPLRDYLRAEAKNNPAVFELTPGPDLAQQVDRLVARIRSSGMTTKEYKVINERVHGR